MRTGWPHPGALPKTSKLLNKRRAVVELKFCMGVQEEGMGVEEEFVYHLSLASVSIYSPVVGPSLFKPKAQVLMCPSYLSNLNLGDANPLFG